MKIRNILHNKSNLTVSTKDLELLLCHILQVERHYLYIHHESEISAEKYTHFITLLNRRIAGEPLAYILNSAEFWSLPLFIDNTVLIPRPETELLVEIALKYLDKNAPLIIADLGTGSGAISLALAHECPHWQIYATDYNPQSLRIAQKNADNLGIKNIEFLLGDWCTALPSFLYFDAIISNPPYVAINDPQLNSDVKKFEPSLALFAGNDGLDAIKKIIIQATHKLKSSGCLMLEHGCNQGEQVRNLLAKEKFNKIQTHLDLARHERTTTAVNI